MPKIPALATLALAVTALGGACAPTPGFTPDPAPTGPALAVTADVAGSKATLHILAQGVGEALGVSVHLRADTAHCAVTGASTASFLGEDARTLAVIRGGDVALGGSHIGPVASTVVDGELATVEVRAIDGLPSPIVLIDALAMRADGTVVPLAPAGGVLTLEVQP